MHSQLKGAKKCKFLGAYTRRSRNKERIDFFEVFGYKKPYRILVDGTFLNECLKIEFPMEYLKQAFDDQKAAPYVTNCVYDRLKHIHTNSPAFLKLLNSCSRLDCGHMKPGARNNNNISSRTDLISDKNNNNISSRTDLISDKNESDRNGYNLDRNTNELDIDNTELDIENTELYVENTELNAENSELDAENTELDAENTELDVENTELDLENTELDVENTEGNSKINETGKSRKKRTRLDKKLAKLNKCQSLSINYCMKDVLRKNHYNRNKKMRLVCASQNSYVHSFVGADGGFLYSIMILSFANGAIYISSPTKAAKKRADDVKRKMVGQLKQLARMEFEGPKTEKKRRKKKPQEPNPLSCKKSKKNMLNGKKTGKRVRSKHFTHDCKCGLSHSQFTCHKIT